MDDLDDAKEENIKRIRPMTIQQFCEKIGYDASNAHRLRKACEALCFECDGRIQHLCAFVTNSTYIKGEYLILNPHIIYGGKDYRVVESLGFLFEWPILLVIFETRAKWTLRPWLREYLLFCGPALLVIFETAKTSSYHGDKACFGISAGIVTIYLWTTLFSHEGQDVQGGLMPEARQTGAAG